jgi:hypothetical protein
MALSTPPRDLSFSELARMARAFDEVDDAEGGRRWPAVRFVEFVRDEMAASGKRIEPAGRPNGANVRKQSPLEEL